MSLNGCFRIAKRDVALMEQLQQCQLESGAQRHAGASLPPDMVGMVDQVTLEFRGDYERLQVARSRFRSIARDVNGQQSELRQRLRHAFSGFRRHRAALARAGFSLDHFGLKVDGTFPEHLTRLREPLEIAKNLLAAHTQVTARGTSCMFDPTQAEIEERVQSLELSLDERKQMRDREQQALLQLRQTRTKATRILRTVRFYLQQMSIDLDATAKRQMLRGYGFIFEPSRKVATGLSQSTEACLTPEGEQDCQSTEEPNVSSGEIVSPSNEEEKAVQPHSMSFKISDPQKTKPKCSDSLYGCQ